MAKPHGSVRIGPISLFALIIILCLAVLAVLSITTARAELSTAERQAATTTETYQLEMAAQGLVAEVDGALAKGALTKDSLATGGTALDAVLAGYGIEYAPSAGAAATPGETIEDETPVPDAAGGSGVALPRNDGAGAITVAGTFDGECLSATFAMESGRTLAVALRVNADGTYAIEQWKATTQWIDDGTGENLWLG